jgi:hypothetical protein
MDLSSFQFEIDILVGNETVAVDLGDVLHFQDDIVV